PPRAHTDRSSDNHAAPTQTDNPQRRPPRLGTTAPSTQPRHQPTATQTTGTATQRRPLPACMSLSSGVPVTDVSGSIGSPPTGGRPGAPRGLVDVDVAAVAGSGGGVALPYPQPPSLADRVS